MTQKLIFLLGAGASKDAGLPLMADLTEGFKRSLGPANASNQRALHLFEQSVAAVATPGQSGYPNIEAVLQLLSDLSSLKVGAASRVVADWKQPFDAPAAIVDDLSRQIREYIRRELESPASADYFHGLLDFRSDQQPVDVFTLNYDRLVESMAARFGVRFTTGFGETWDPRLFEIPGWDLRLFKLHGSVDWYRVSSQNVVYRGSPGHYAFPGETASDVLLYPTRGKTAQADPFATLMALFTRALSEATCCIAIGYSFRDYHIRRTVLDRMTTNRSLQLLIVNPNAQDVLDLPPDQSDEPYFWQFRNRVAGLWFGAQYALANRAIRTRLDEIDTADSLLWNAAQVGNRRQFQNEAQQIYEAIEYCRIHDLPYKPQGLLSQPAGAEFDAAFAGEVRRQLEGFANMGTFESSTTEIVVQRIGQLVNLWALAVSVAPNEVERARKALTNVMTQWVSSVAFSANGQDFVWTGSRHTDDNQALVQKRADDLKALGQDLSRRGPLLALDLGNDRLTRGRYESLHDGIGVLALFYDSLARCNVRGVQYDGRYVISSRDALFQTSYHELSNRLFKSKLPDFWLEHPAFAGQLPFLTQA